jgi:hypothetical protein
MFVRMQANQPESAWIDRIYDAVREPSSARHGALSKRSAKPDKAFRDRLDDIESAAKKLQSSQEQ